MAGRGGARIGAGRKPKVVQRKAEDLAMQVLQECDAKGRWMALLKCGEARVMADVLKYLTNRVYGCPAQTIQGNPDKPVAIVLQFGSNPEWLKR